MWKKLMEKIENANWYEISSRIAGFSVFFSWFIFFCFMIAGSVCGAYEKEMLVLTIPIAAILFVLSIVFLFVGF